MGNKSKRTQRGVSLIEVLVVLVLLVLGILIIVRLYPSGFFSITSVGNAALADSLGQAAVQSQTQGTEGLPEAILPGTLKQALATDAASQSAQFQAANYDPEYNPIAQPNYTTILDNAKVVLNETVTIPGGNAGQQPVYVVKYGPIKMPVGADAPNATDYLVINSLNWKAAAGNFNDALATPPNFPQQNISVGQQQFLVDYANAKVALPYALKYSQSFVLKVVAQDSKTYEVDFTLPFTGNAGPPVSAEPSLGSVPYPDTQTYYNGGWFDPAGSNTDPTGGTYTYNKAMPQGLPPKPWRSVTLYHPFKGLAAATVFSADPYEYKMADTNPGQTPGDGNLGAISFNPLAGGGSGSYALKAQISYQVYSWKVLHEDRDVPALPGGNTTSLRLTLKNLKRAGDPNPDNTIFTGIIPNTSLGLIIMDLDSGKIVLTQTGGAVDPTAYPYNDEDIVGTSTANNIINVSYATGRITLGSNAFGDNPDPGKTPHTHRIRIFYAGDADWTVAVQKAPSHYTPTLNPVSGGNDPQLQPSQYAFEPTSNLVYFPRNDAGRTVEVDGTYVMGTGASVTLHTFAETAAVSPVINLTLVSPYVTINLADTQLAAPLPSGATQVTVSSVRGLSVRSVVAWKERDRFKVHSVDTLLNRAQ